MYVYSYTFFFGAKEKLQNAPRFEMDFVLNFAMCSADFACVNGSTIQIVLCELLKGLTFWILSKNFQETASPSIVLSLFTQISAKHVCDTTASKLVTLHASLLRRCDVDEFYTIFQFRVQFLDTFRYAANEFYSKICFTAFYRLLI